ncbi:MAG: hypothetical protein AAB036_10165 [Elusimicrobiota bacterium]
MDWASVAAWTGLLMSLRAGTSDFALRPDRWETRATIPMVESILRAPLSGPQAVDELEKRLAAARNSAQLLSAGFDSLGVAASAPHPVSLSTPMAGLEPKLAAGVAELVARLNAARADLNLAVASLSAEERVRARAAIDAAVAENAFVATRGTDFDAARRFDLPRLAAAGLAAARAVDEALPVLQSARAAGLAPFSIRSDSEIGAVVVSAGDADIEAEDLSHAGLIIRLGGRTRYKGPAASAASGQIRVVIDLAGPCVIESSSTAAGAGDFGIGLLYLLGPGPHRIQTGELSLGAARFGVGYAQIDGDSTTLVSGRFSQAAASFGVGVLQTRGAGAALSAPLAAQGFATTGGAGLWRHTGDAASATCGFEIADPRETLGFVSQGQGAGMGPRAFAAGGIGAAHLSGDDISLNASYFAQGSGYWHGLGALFVRGKRARLQSRRYGLGTGVHAAVGALDIQGDDARLQTWGVGPGFAWDYGVGLFRLRGDRAHLRSDWADGRADLGGRALAWIEGDDARLSLAEFGSGSYTRAQAGYGLAVIKGRGNRLRAAGLSAPMGGRFERGSGSWGRLRAEGELILDPALSLPDPVWPVQNPGAAAARRIAEQSQSTALLSELQDPGGRARLSKMLFAAAAQILDSRPAETAARALAGLSASDAPALAEALDVDRFSELMWARVAASGLGPAAARAAAAEAASAQGVRRAALLDWLRFGSAADVLPQAEKALRDLDWRVRRQGASVIGSLFADDGGVEPGRRRLLRADPNAAPETLGQKRLSDLYSALALSAPASESERTALLAAAKSPFDAAAPEALNVYRVALASSPARVDALRREEADCARLLPRARSALRQAVSDADDEVASAALSGLGGLGDLEDAPLIAEALEAPSALRREAAAAALARLGPSGRAQIKRALTSSKALTRALGAAAAAQSWDEASYLLIATAFDDEQAFVRAAAVAALPSTPATLAAAKAGLLGRLRRLAASDPDLGVRVSAALAVADLAPAR